MGNEIMREFCGKCDEISEVTIKIIPETYVVKNEEMTIDADVAFCKVCGSKVHSPALDDKTLRKAFAAYRDESGQVVAEWRVQDVDTRFVDLTKLGVQDLERLS